MSKQLEIQDRITQLVIHQLQAGAVAWRKPFRGMLPSSGVTGKAYRGINAFILGMYPFDSNLWVTFKGAKDLGGSVNKGASGVHLVKYGSFDKQVQDKVTGELSKQRVPFMRSFVVFNLEQTTGVEVNPDYLLPTTPVEVPSAVQSVLDSYKGHPSITHDTQGSAYYLPSADTITLPKLELFESGVAYFETLAHELAHSTGHESRLNRHAGQNFKFGCKDYAGEELVAEMTASMLLNHFGIEFDIDNSASYLANWLGALSNDVSLLTKASAKANKAFDMILGIKTEAPSDE